MPNCPPTLARSCCRGSCSRTYGWGSTVDPILPALSTGRWRCATSCPTPTCGRRHAVDGRRAAAAGAAPSRPAAAAAAAARRRRAGRGKRRRARAQRRHRARRPRPRARPRAGSAARTGVRRSASVAWGDRDARPAGGCRRWRATTFRRAGHRARRAGGAGDARRRLGGDARRPRGVRRARRRAPPGLRRRPRPRPSSAPPPRAGAELVIGDGNRRRVVVRRARGRRPARRSRPPRSSRRTPRSSTRSDAGTAAQTVAVYDGMRAVREDVLPGVAQFPEQRPFAALDGSTETAWVAPAARRARAPLDGGRAGRAARRAVRRRAPARRRARAHDGGRDRAAGASRCGPAGTACRSGCAACERAARDARTRRPGAGRRTRGGGIAELRIPGVTAREWLRPPRRARGRAARRRPRPLVAHLRPAAHDRRDPVPPRALSAPAAVALRARPRRRRAADRAPDRPAGGARVRGRRLGDRLPTRPIARSTAGGHRRRPLRLVRAVRGRARAAGVAGVRRRPGHRVDRAVAARARGVGGLDDAARHHAAHAAPAPRAGVRRPERVVAQRPRPPRRRRGRRRRARRAPAAAARPRVPARDRRRGFAAGTRPHGGAERSGSPRSSALARARSARRGSRRRRRRDWRTGCGSTRPAARCASTPPGASCALRPVGSVADFDAGRPLRAQPCGEPRRSSRPARSS